MRMDHPEDKYTEEEREIINERTVGTEEKCIFGRYDEAEELAELKRKEEREELIREMTLQDKE